MSYVAYNGRSSGFLAGKEQYEDEFNQLRGTVSPHGAAMATPLSADQYFGDGKYRTVKGNAHEAGWGNFVPPGYEKVAFYGPDSGQNESLMVLRRTEEKAAAPAPAPKPQEPAYEPDKAKMAEALNRAQLAKDQYAASIPTLDTGKDPYSSASAYGRQMQDSLLKYQDFADAKAGAQTTEISEAGKSALSRFEGAVADYKLPNWRDYLNA